VWQTPRSPSWAFYGLHTRAWEFALAGALALVPATRWERLPGSVRLATGWIGAAAVAWAVVAFDATTPYPGTAALVPVLGTLALLVAGSSTARAGSVPWLLDTGPTRWLGRVSYSWYLWHWPAIVLTVAVVDDPGTRTRVAAALGSLAVAAAVHHLVENPVRFSPALAASSRRTLVLGGLLTLVAVAAAVVAPRVAPVEDRDLAAELAAARADRSRDDCEREERTDEGLAYCVSGAPDGTATVLLVGDSHARHWKAALGEAAARAGVRLVDRWHPRCPAVAVAISPPGGGGLDHELVRGCLEHRRGTDRLLEELAPEVVVVSDSRGYTPLVLTDAGETQPRARQAEQWATRFDELLARIEAVGATPVVVLDNPRLPEDPVTCLSARGDEDACAPPADEALATIAELQDAELAVLDRRRAEGREVLTFSVTEDICGGDRCVLRERGELVWADQGHFTTAFTTTRVDELVEVLERSLGRRGWS
jgi:hypothetical protein